MVRKPFGQCYGSGPKLERRLESHIGQIALPSQLMLKLTQSAERYLDLVEKSLPNEQNSCCSLELVLHL